MPEGDEWTNELRAEGGVALGRQAGDATVTRALRIGSADPVLAERTSPPPEAGVKRGGTAGGFGLSSPGIGRKPMFGVF